MNYRDHFSGPEVLAVLRQHGRMHFRTLCSVLGVHGLTAQGGLIHLLAELNRQRLILSDTSDFSGWESDATIELAPSVQELAQVLGLSIKELVGRDPENSIIVTPFFGRPTDSVDAGSDVFVLMPFRESLQAIYEDHIKLVTERLELTVRRADDLFSAREVMKDVWDGICTAKVVVADCTDRNPNVFYEIGLAHAVGKPVILITQSAEDVPFDLRSIRYIRYQYTPPGMKAFESTLRETLLATVKSSR